MAGSQAISEEEEEFSLTYCDSLFTVLETGERASSDLGDSAPPWRCFPMSRFTYAVFPPLALALVCAGCQSARDREDRILAQAALSPISPT